MAVVVQPIDASSGSPAYSAQQSRQAFSSLMAMGSTSRPLGALSGVRPGTPATTVSLSGTTWTCAAHSGVLDLESAVNAAPYQYATDGTDTGSLNAADGTNSRTDILYVQVNDTVQDGTGQRGGVVGYLAGAADGSNNPPATPARSVVLAQFTVPKSGNGNPTVTWVAPYTSAAGGVVPVTATTRPTGYPSLEIFETDNKALRIWDGTQWMTVKAAKVRVAVGASDGAVSNTAWTAHPNSPTVTVKAPPSGKLLVTFGGSILIGGSTSTYGTGTLGVQANGAGLSNVVASDTAAHASMGQSSANVVNTTIITGLTADQSVTLTLVDQVASGGNAIYFNGRWMLVEQM